MPRRKDKILARITLTILSRRRPRHRHVLHQCVEFYDADTLSRWTESYLLPRTGVIVVNRRVVDMNLARIYTWTKDKNIMRFNSWDELPRDITKIGSFALFPFV